MTKTLFALLLLAASATAQLNNAKSIWSKPIDNSTLADGYVLTYSSSAGKYIWAAPAVPPTIASTASPLKGDGAGNAVAAANVPICAKYTVAYNNAGLNVAATSADVALFTMPAQGKLQGTTTKPSIQFTGTAVTGLTVSVGCAATGCTNTSYSPAFDVLVTAVGATNMQDSGGHFSPTFASHAVNAHFISTGGNLNALTAGSVDIWACTVTLP